MLRRLSASSVTGSAAASASGAQLFHVSDDATDARGFAIAQARLNPRHGGVYKQAGTLGRVGIDLDDRGEHGAERQLVIVAGGLEAAGPAGVER